MGQSTNAIIWYGYAFNDEGRPPWQSEDDDEDEDDEERLKRLSGVPSWKEGETQAERKQRWEHGHRVLAEAKCEVVTHCSGDYPMYGVAVKVTRKTAYRGSPEALKLPAVDPEWTDQLKAYCQFMGIDVGTQEPQWWLASPCPQPVPHEQEPDLGRCGRRVHIRDPFISPARGDHDGVEADDGAALDGSLLRVAGGPMSDLDLATVGAYECGVCRAVTSREAWSAHAAIHEAEDEVAARIAAWVLRQQDQRTSDADEALWDASVGIIAGRWRLP